MVVKKDRNSNFEIMRIISMIFIILWHIIMHGNMLENSYRPSINVILEIMQYIIVVHVNSFVLLSGYFQSKSKFKLSKFLSLILQVIFYSILILIFCIKFNVIQDYNLVSFINNLLPSSVNNYWFINMYIVVYLLSDIINKFINSLDKKNYERILILLFILFSIVPLVTGGRFFANNGYNFYNFIFLYLIGGYLSRYKIKDSYYFKRLSTNGYRCLLIFVFVLMVFLNYSVDQFAYRISGYSNIMAEISNRILTMHLAYSSPFAIIQTICYFLFFETFKFKNKFINIISSCTFGIYLFHDNPLIRKFLYKVLRIDVMYVSYKMLIKLVIALVVIFVAGVIIELIRKLLVKLLLKLKITNKIINKFREFINSFNYKINW